MKGWRSSEEILLKAAAFAEFSLQGRVHRGVLWVHEKAAEEFSKPKS